MDLGSHYWLLNAHIPHGLIHPNFGEVDLTLEGLVLCDLEINAGKIIRINKAGSQNLQGQIWDLKKRITLPCFVDMHTHLDKGHIWERTPNPDGTFNQALTAAMGDRLTEPQYDDIYQRMEFGLKCSYAQGTKAIRTHLDCPWPQFELTLKVFADLQKAWSDRLVLQPTSLITLNEYVGSRGEVIADRMAELGGVLGGVAYQNPHLDLQLDRLFELAIARNLAIDLHTDETDDPSSQTLKATAQAALRHGFKNQIVCGHCCSLARQTETDVEATLELVRSAAIGIVSLPMCNLYLQDRHPQRTPRWRGITLIHELNQADIRVAIASDNVRDPFFGFGNHDCLEVFSTAVKIAHLDTPYCNWIKTVTTTPAQLMEIESNYIEVGIPADLVIFSARYYSELLSRPQGDRIVIRKGYKINTQLPSYAELDHLNISIGTAFCKAKNTV